MREREKIARETRKKEATEQCMYIKLWNLVTICYSTESEPARRSEKWSVRERERLGEVDVNVNQLCTQFSHDTYGILK